MDNNRSRYQMMDKVMTVVLALDAVIYLAYLIFAGTGLIAMKVIAAILCFLISGAALYFLYMTRELLRKRSIWMTLAAAGIILCIVVSLILRFPAPAYTLPQA